VRVQVSTLDNQVVVLYKKSLSAFVFDIDRTFAIEIAASEPATNIDESNKE